MSYEPQTKQPYGNDVEKGSGEFVTQTAADQDLHGEAPLQRQ